MKDEERYWHGYQQATLRKYTTGISEKDLEALGSGSWMILVLLVGETKHSLDYSGVMEPVCYSYNRS